MTEFMATVTANEAPALEVRDLVVRLHGEGGAVTVVDGVSFGVPPGKTLCLVGESGCGKTTTALATLRLEPASAEIAAGSVLVEGANMVGLPRHRIEDIRGTRIAMIFQEPLTALNPVMTIGEQIAEGVRRHWKRSKTDARRRAIEMLRLVRMPDPEHRARQFPHELSGGQRQRAMIALALACDPRILVADEPTTALDVTIQAQILRLMRSLQQRLGTALLLITHDFGVVAEMADRVAVMYAGRIVEDGPVTRLFDEPLHPYTRMLMQASPRSGGGGGKAPLANIPGTVPSFADLPAGCAFHPRCPLAVDRCRRERPDLEAKRADHAAACFLVPVETADAA